MEVIILRGESTQVQNVSHLILGTKGVTHGNLTMTAVDSSILHEHAHAHGHTHPHAH